MGGPKGMDWLLTIMKSWIYYYWQSSSLWGAAFLTGPTATAASDDMTGCRALSQVCCAGSVRWGNGYNCSGPSFYTTWTYRGRTPILWPRSPAAECATWANICVWFVSKTNFFMMKSEWNSIYLYIFKKRRRFSNYSIIKWRVVYIIISIRSPFCIIFLWLLRKIHEF